MIPAKTVERLIVYRRLLSRARQVEVFSHELAHMANVTAVQVRRDLMNAGVTGSPRRGYVVADLLDRLTEILDRPEGHNAALVGVGNLGLSLLSYFAVRHDRIKVVAAFDADPDKVCRVVSGCRCYDVRELADRAAELDITIGIIAVPAPAAQPVADALVEAGIKGILNFAPVPLRTPPEVLVEQVDIMRALEKVAHFAKRQREE
jgi:redox-sensing transcriptional repressor